MKEIRKRRQQVKNEPQIIGGSPAGAGKQAPKILDQRTQPTPVEIQEKQHGEVVTVSSHVRSRPRKKDEPDVRIHSLTQEERQAWNKVKNLEWEDE